MTEKRNGAQHAEKTAAGGSPDRTSGVPERAFTGAVVVADMAGYTRFTEHLVSASSDGIDRLGRSIERSFRDYAQVVSAHDGRIVTLAGDAVIAIWSFEPAGERHTTRRAVACARQLLQAASRHSLLLHIGVATGGLWAGSCAGFEREVDTVFGGAAMRLAFRAARAADGGEIRTTARVLTELGIKTPHESSALVPLPADTNGTGEVPIPSDDCDSLWNAELRDVAPLFVRWRHFDESVPGDWRAHRSSLLLAQETTGTSGATGRLVIDDEGLVLVSVFGEPGSARLEAPEVIAKRAGALVERLQREHAAVVAGLAFGRVFCSDIECASDRWKVSIGPALNTAARLMDRAGEGLLVAGLPGEHVPAFVSPQAKSMQLRGVRDPVRVFRYDPHGQRAPEVVLFERDEELVRIDALLAATAKGAGVACLIRADAGVGKSALLAAVETRAQARGLPIARGAAQTNERAAPYFLWRRILRDLVPAASSREPSTLIAHLESIGADPALASLLDSVFHLGFPTTAISEALSGKARSEATLELMFRLITHAVRTPTLISIEDLQFADPASIELIERVGLQLSNVMLVITARPAASTSELIYRLSGPRYHQIDLKPLTRTGIDAMVRFELKGPSSPSLVDCIEEASRGNALFALEYLRLLHVGGRIANDGGAFRLAEPLDSATVPSTVIGAVSSRIHTLLPREQRLLKIASVLGPSFSRDLLHHAAPDYAPTELDMVLANLERSGLVVQESLREDTLGFSHDLIRDAAYETMLHEQKRHVHAEVGRILEHRREHQIRSLLPSLVHHSASAGDDARVVKYGELAAMDALKQGSYGDAIEFLRMCLASAAKLPAQVIGRWTYVRWHRWLAEAAGATGQLSARREHASEALKLAGIRLARSAFAARLAALWQLILRIVLRVPLSTRSRETDATRPQHIDTANALHELAYASYFSGEGDWFLYYVLKALSYAERGRDVTQVIEFSALAGACMGYAGFERVGAKYMAAAHAVASSHGQEQAVAASYMHSALYLIGRGAWDEVANHIDRCQANCRKLGSNYLWGSAQIIRFWLHWYRGDCNGATVSAQELLTAAEHSGNRQHLRWAHRSLALVRRAEGNFEQATAHMQLARALLATDADLNEVVQVTGTAAELCLVTGDVAEAEALADRMLERLLRAPRLTGHAMLEGCSGVACVAIQLLERDSNDVARKNRARQAVRVLKKYATVFPVGLPRYHYWRGRFLRATGRRRRAAAALRRARWTAQDLGIAYEFTMVGDRFRDSAFPAAPNTRRS